jgi:hypothetical protein
MNRIEIDVITGERKVVELTAQEVAQLQTAEAERLAAIPYSVKRTAEFPPITDYIDGVVKGDQAQIDKYIADCLAVKAKFPKGVA